MSTAILQLNTLNETLAFLQKEMNLLASSLPEYDTVMNLFGVGSVLGSQLIAEIGDVSRFSNKKLSLALRVSTLRRSSLAILIHNPKVSPNAVLPLYVRHCFRSCLASSKTLPQTNLYSFSWTKSVPRENIFTFA